jgi:hypothetical protein
VLRCSSRQVVTEMRGSIGHGRSHRGHGSRPASPVPARGGRRAKAPGRGPSPRMIPGTKDRRPRTGPRRPARRWPSSGGRGGDALVGRRRPRFSWHRRAPCRRAFGRVQPAAGPPRRGFDPVDGRTGQDDEHRAPSDAALSGRPNDRLRAPAPSGSARGDPARRRGSCGSTRALATGPPRVHRARGRARRSLSAAAPVPSLPAAR